VQLIYGHFSLAHQFQQLIIRHESAVDHPLLEPVQVAQHRLKFVFQRPCLIARFAWLEIRPAVKRYPQRDQNGYVRFLCPS
jgi:hypothetical protein